MTAFHELARVSAERMLNGVVEGVAIAMFVGLMLQIVGRRNFRTRFALLLAALFTMAVLPLWNVARASAGAAPATDAVWAVTMPSQWATCIMLVWAVLAAVGLLRVAVGLWQLRKLRTESEILDPVNLDPALQRTLAEFESSGQVRIAVSEKLAVPAAIGFFEPLIVLPNWALQELSIAELNTILIHELAHLQRRDDWTNLAQKLLQALLFFHPAVWWVERQLSLEREMACDDVVLARTANPRAYAQCLVAVAERSFMRRGLAMAQAAVSKMRQTTVRVSQILNGNRSTAKPAWKPAMAVVTLASAIFVAGLARAPELLAFREGAAPVRASLAVPASLPKDSPAAKAVLTSFQPKRTRPSRVVAATPFGARVAAPGDDYLVKAAAVSASPEAAPTQTVLVVMRTEEFGPSGASWTVRVWRFTMLKAEQIPIELTIPAKSL